MTTADPKPDFLPEDLVPYLAGLAINARDKNWSNSKVLTEVRKLQAKLADAVVAAIEEDGQDHADVVAAGRLLSRVAEYLSGYRAAVQRSAEVAAKVVTGLFEAGAR